MKKMLILASLLLASASVSAALPCSWQSNWGYLKFITPSPQWSSVRFALTGGQTQASIYGTFNLPVPPSTDGVKTELFRQTMELLRDAHSRSVMISVETSSDSCSKAVALPNVSFVTTQIWFK
jgi:hypothetical protein